MNKLKLILVALIVLMYLGLLTGCGAVEQRLADGTAVAAGNPVGGPFGDGGAADGSGGGADEQPTEDPLDSILDDLDGSGGGDEPTNTIDPAALGTSIVQTVNAINSLTPEASATETLEPTVEQDDVEGPTATITGAQFTALAQTLTAIANATETPQITNTPSGDAVKTTQPSGETPEVTAAPCNAFRFVAHVSYPPNSTVAASSAFFKSWQIQNTGSCTWSGDYALLYHSGFQLGGTSPLRLGTGVVVHPGQYVTVTIQLFTPPQPGTYDSQWWMQDANGNTFGGGENRNVPLSAVVVVPGVPNPVFTSPASTAPPFYTNTPSP